MIEAVVRVLAALIVLVGCAHAAPIKCPVGDASIVVDTSEHRMALCEAGKPIEELPVAIGGGGTGKVREGDRKTPIGSFALAAPRTSSKFHVFIGIGYPTSVQISQGATGGDVGIHGPSRRYGWLSGVRNWFDWTDGCIAVASDQAIDRVARWVRDARPGRVEIR
jgi:murein L,D-transpeptidase YafK